MRFHQALCAVAIVLIVTIVAPTTSLAQNAAARPVDAAQVISAIDRGIAYLKRDQQPRGHWGELPGYDGGVTALCTLALLNSGVPADDPVVREGIAYLRGLELDKTYTISLQTMVLCAAKPQEDMLIIRRNVKWLEDHQIKDGPRKGCWSYPGPGGDNSNAQFAVLALYDAQRVGAEVSRDTWVLAADYWRNTQNEDGSWGYVPGDAGTGSMTCAGIGGLAVSSAALESGDAAVENGRVICCRPHDVNDSLDRAIDWLAAQFSVTHNPRPAGGGQACLYYYLYGLERAGRLTARRFIGEHDWYREGAEFLVHEQDSLSHFWKGTWYAEREPRISTAMALLFLSKGRRPIVMAKVKYGEGDVWNQHRRDAAHLTAYTEDAWGLGLTWQVMDPEKANVEDLLQAPVLYISGSQAPALFPYARKLRDYVDRGGFIFAEACCTDSARFDVAFRQLMTMVFPEDEYKLASDSARPSALAYARYRPPRLPVRRPPVRRRIWLPHLRRLLRSRSFVLLGTRPPRPVEELSGRCHAAHRRCPGDRRQRANVRHQPRAQRQRAGVRNAAGRRGRFSRRVDPRRHRNRQAPPRRRLQRCARRAAQPAPHRFSGRTQAPSSRRARAHQHLRPRHLPLSHGVHARAVRFPFHRGRAQCSFASTSNGVARCLPIRSAPAKLSPTAFRREIAAALPGTALTRIPITDPIFSNSFGGFDIRNVSLRDPASAEGNQPVAARVRQVEPQLEGIQIDGRWAVIFSPYDISCALESHEAVGCRGYTQQDAARIGLNVLLYSLNQ